VNYGYVEIRDLCALQPGFVMRQGKRSFIFMYRRRILCTSYGAVDFLIVQSKGLYGWGGGGGGWSRAKKLLF
jgi:hypothetical protein